MILQIWRNQTRTFNKIKRNIKKWFITAERLIAFLVICGFILSTAPLVSAETIEAPIDATRVMFDNTQFYAIGYKTDQVSIAITESRFEAEQRRLANEAAARTTTREVVSRTGKGRVELTSEPELGVKRALAKRAAEAVGIPQYWRIIEAVWQVESGKRWQTAVKSYAGAQGPMQFVRGTWNKYKVDGNGDGVFDINLAEDAVYAGANLLAQAGLRDGHVDRALFAYNHATWYVTKVKKVADTIVE